MQHRQSPAFIVAPDELQSNLWIVSEQRSTSQPAHLDLLNSHRAPSLAPQLQASSFIGDQDKPMQCRQKETNGCF